MVKTGLYTIKDEFFSDMEDPYLKFNKGTHSKRPHYYCLKDDNIKGIYWMIPLSSRIDKYERIIQRRLTLGMPCDILHIAKLDNGRKSVFLIQDIFPITDDYIYKQYTIKGTFLRVTSEYLVSEIENKAMKILSLIKRDIRYMPTQPDVVKIYNKLTNDMKNKDPKDLGV